MPLPKVTPTAVKVAKEMIKNEFSPGKGLGAALQGITKPIHLPGSTDTFGLGFKPTIVDIQRAKRLKKKGWTLPKPIPKLSNSFVKPGTQRRLATVMLNRAQIKSDEELLARFERLYEDVNVIETVEGTSKMDIQFFGPHTMLNNWEATPLPIRRELW